MSRRFDRPASPDLRDVLDTVSAGAAERDEHMAWPKDAFDALCTAGILSAKLPRAEQWSLIRMVARADASVGRILDGHFNAVERIELHAPEPLRTHELQAIAAGERLLGVWGADPIPAEGEPAHVVGSGGRAVLRGVKVYCSGAGGLDRALVVARSPEQAPLLAYVDATERVVVDETWWRSSGMRASASHRVVFHDAPVIALLGGPGALGEEPHFSFDAIRTATTWAGSVDAAIDAALEFLAAKKAADDLSARAAARMERARLTIDAWLDLAARLDPRDIDRVCRTSVLLRDAVADAGRLAFDEAAAACGSRPFATGDALDRARRDFQVFVLQHRLDPLVARAGRRLIEDQG